MDPQLLHDQLLLWQHDTFAHIATLQCATFEKAHRQYLAKKRGRLHFDIGNYILLDKDWDHKLDINTGALTEAQLWVEALRMHDEMALNMVLHHYHVTGKLKLRAHPQL
eukprot:m51a1_g6596 hypothetical protein (109) ;mRNA; r:298380-298983